MDNKVVITDVDGVLTTGQFLYDETGKKFKIFGPHDSDGVYILRKLGYEVIAITADGRGFKISEARCNDMGIQLYLVEEGERLKWIKKRYKLKDVIYIGDGLHDIPVMRDAYLSFCPGDAMVHCAEYANVVQAGGARGMLLAVALYLALKYHNLSYKDFLHE